MQNALLASFERIKDIAQSQSLRLITRQLPLPPEVKDWRIAFCGASVGAAWRLKFVFPTIQLYTEYDFDKSKIIQRAIADGADAIMLKECAAYFPAHRDDFPRYRDWIEEIKGAQIAPIMVTVVPVTHQHAAEHPGRIEAIHRFNDQIRSYAQEKNVALLDLEKALRISLNDRYLKEEFDNGDGLHLCYQTYRSSLDHLIPIALSNAYQRHA